MSNKYFWYCNACGAQNSREDGECQFCECGGATCKRDNCSGPAHEASFQLEDHGSIWLIRPLTDAFMAWLHETAPGDAQFLGNAMAIEPRYVKGVVEAAQEAGFVR